MHNYTTTELPATDAQMKTNSVVVVVVVVDKCTTIELPTNAAQMKTNSNKE